MINHRNSEDYLHSDVILSKITEYDIFKHYCSNFKELGVKFCSDLRKDSRPGVSIVDLNGKLLYKDFAHLEHTFNCFGYVMHKYSLDFVGALQLISQDFGLGLVPTSVRPTARTYVYQKVPTKRAVINIKSRLWNKDDANYWSKFCISKAILRKFDVQPIEYFWINETRFRSPNHCYAFRFHNGYKIYSPYETDNKWYSNVGKETIQGYKQLPEYGEIVFLTSSLKDVMCLGVLGYSAVALQSEMQMPDENFIQEIRSRFKEIIVLYDNDFESERNPGQEMAKKICERFNLRNLLIPDVLCSKDISDLIKSQGLNKARTFITNEICKLTKNELTKYSSDAPF